MKRQQLAPGIAEMYESPLTPEEFERLTAVPPTEEELAEFAELVGWFTRRYPTPGERLTYARRKYAEWTRHPPARIDGYAGPRVFLSHSTRDKDEIQRLRKAFADRGVPAWEDVLELRLGDSLDALRAAIQDADAFLLYLTPRSIGSDWVQREVAWALEARKVVLPLIRGLDRGALKLLVGGADLVSIALEEDAPIETAVPAILQALGLAPQNATPRPDPEPAPAMAELILELAAPRKHEEGDQHRAAAHARVTYRPAGDARRVDGPWVEFLAPIGPREADELTWYLESYILWPFGTFKDRARKIEESLPHWGRMLFDALPGQAGQAQAVSDWRDGKGNPPGARVERRVTIFVDPRDADAEAAAMLLALPWELLADRDGYLFEGNLRARVRRRLPSDRTLEAAEPRLPLRVLLVLARPEEEGVSFLDPRASALTLVEALDDLGGDVELTVLGEGTVKALREALDAGAREGRPYQVVHFDGHGIYDRKTGLGRLCFEDADDAAKGLLTRRAHRVDARELGQMLRDHRVPLFVLEACQSAAAETRPTASVAAELLRAGVASVVAMSHSVLVETARRWVGEFYRALAEGDRIGTAMVRAQRALKDDRVRGEVQGQGRLELSDWLVPVLFQEDADARLFPGGVDMRPAMVEDRRTHARVQRGDLPEPPKHRFVGRARALLTIDRRLQNERWLALVGRGGEGKTALAVEAARWMLAMRRVERVAFASVERIGEARAVLDVIGRQLVAGYSVAAAEGTGSDEEKLRRAMLPVKQVLGERRVLVLVDNMESVLPAPGEKAEDEVGELLGMLKEIAETGGTRLLLTSRESLPEPLAGREYRVPWLEVREARELLAGVLRAGGQEPAGGSKEEKEEKKAVEALIEAVGGHPRSLVLLGALVAEQGVEAVTKDVRTAMAELEARHPDERERSLIASVRLSLRRLPEGVKDKVRGLGVFHGVAQVEVMAHVLQIKPEEAVELCRQLSAVGLADADGAYLLMDPGLGPTLAAEMAAEEREVAEGRWLAAMRGLVASLYERQAQDTYIAAHGARTALGEMLAALHKIQREITAGHVGVAEAINYVVSLESLVSNFGSPRVIKRISAVRTCLVERLPAWSHARFIAEAQEVDRAYEAGNVPMALRSALALHKAAEEGGDAYPEATYDRALACWQLGRMLRASGHTGEAFQVLDESQQRFARLAASGNRSAARMESTVMCDTGDVFADMGRLDDAAAAYCLSAERATAAENKRSVAVARANLGSVLRHQRRFAESLAAYEDAKNTFEALGEPASVAITWHNIGWIHSEVRDYNRAEHAYRQSLALDVARGDSAGQASTLNKLGGLYQDQNRLEEATSFLRQAAHKYQDLGDVFHESMCHNNLAIVLHGLGRLREAMDALNRALALGKPYGYATHPWKTWSTLFDVERDAGRPEKARNARGQAIVAYRAYRENGGEPDDAVSQFVAIFGKTLRDSGPVAACALLPNSAQVPVANAPICRALHAIAAGSYDRALADDPALFPLHAVELALLLESLPPASPAPPPPPAPAADAPCPCGSERAFLACHGAPGGDG